MTTTKAEELAARLESGWCSIESPADMERAAAELRRLAALEVGRDALRKDAERYRWLRDIGDETWVPLGKRPSVVFTYEIDAAIDAAISTAMKGTT